MRHPSDLLKVIPYICEQKHPAPSKASSAANLIELFTSLFHLFASLRRRHRANQPSLTLLRGQGGERERAAQQKSLVLSLPIGKLSQSLLTNSLTTQCSRVGPMQSYGSRVHMQLHIKQPQQNSRILKQKASLMEFSPLQMARIPQNPRNIRIWDCLPHFCFKISFKIFQHLRLQNVYHIL